MAKPDFIRFYLRNCFVEEASEIQIELSKIFRFGPESYNPEDPEKKSNITRMSGEIGDLLAVIKLSMFHETGNPEAGRFLVDPHLLTDNDRWPHLTAKDIPLLNYLENLQIELLKTSLRVAETHAVTENTRNHIHNLIHSMFTCGYIDGTTFTRHYQTKIRKIAKLSSQIAPLAESLEHYSGKPNAGAKNHQVT